MFEITSTRHNPLIDPLLAVWSWEIPIYLFLGGIVAGMMVLAGIAMLRVARGDDPMTFFSLQTPLLGFVLMNVGMFALFLDLTHKLYVWRVFTTFQPTSPMSWGSWVLIAVYLVLLVSASVRLPDAWPWLGRKLPQLAAVSERFVARRSWLSTLAWANVGLGVALGVYTGILLDTMAARPLWNSAIIGPLFLFSGLSSGAALIHLVSGWLPGDRPAPASALAGALSALIQPIGTQRPGREAANGLIRADLGFLVVELVLIGLLIVNLQTSSASHSAAAALILTGPYAWAFWGLVVGVGVLAPLVWQALELSHRVVHTVVPAVMVLVGGYTLRWVMVNAGQISQILPLTGLGQ